MSTQSNLNAADEDQGQLAEGIAALQEAVCCKPDCADAHYNLGIAYRTERKLDEAVACCQEALRIRPNFAEAHYNLGVALALQGRLTEAMASFQQALHLRPDYPEAYRDLGVIFQQAVQGREVNFRQALPPKAHVPEARIHKSAVLPVQEKLDEAIASIHESLPIRPDSAEAYANLGSVFQGHGLPEKAITCYAYAARLDPNNFDAHQNLATVLLLQGQLEEAIAHFQQALRLRPDQAETHHNLGAALLRQDRPAQAIASFQQAIHLRPDYAEAYFNVGFALLGQGMVEEALAWNQQALRLKPDYADAHLARACALLLAGDFEGGWLEYEWRWRCLRFVPPPLHFPRPPWDGSPLEGRTILLRAEQGLGDTLQFIRYVPLVQKLGGRTIVEAHAPLLPLLRTCPGTAAVIALGEVPPPFDVHAYLLSLPRLLGTTLDTVPANVPYLSADPSLVAHWGEELSAVSGFKVGIVWQGSPNNDRDRIRSLPLTEFAPLAELAGVHLFSLQVGPGREQLAALDGRFAVTDLGSRFDPASFAETAAVVKNLDLVITVDTALAHLAGALGVPVWVALPFSHDFRWLQGREDSPWYPSMRLFRQPEVGQWPAVLQRIAAEIRKLLASRGGFPLG